MPYFKVIYFKYFTSTIKLMYHLDWFYQCVAT